MCLNVGRVSQLGRRLFENPTSKQDLKYEKQSHRVQGACQAGNTRSRALPKSRIVRHSASLLKGATANFFWLQGNGAWMEVDRREAAEGVALHRQVHVFLGDLLNLGRRGPNKVNKLDNVSVFFVVLLGEFSKGVRLADKVS